MSKINKQKLLDETEQLFHQLFPVLKIRNTSLEDNNSYFTLQFDLDGMIAVQINIDMMDSLIEFLMIRLDKNGNPIPGYNVDANGKRIRVYLTLIFTYLKVSFDKKKSFEIFRLPSGFYLGENANQCWSKKLEMAYCFLPLY